MDKIKIRIKIKGYDHKVVDKAVAVIIRNAVGTGAKIVGPVPLPTRKYKVAVLRSPHVNAISKEHFMIKTHKRLIEILEPNAKTVDALTHLQLPAGVEIEIKS